MNAEFVEGDRLTRFRILAFAAILLLLMLVNHLTLPAPSSPALARETFKMTLDRLLIIALFMGPFYLGLAIYLLRLGVKVMRSAQYPPPEMRVPVRTRIRRGRLARSKAMLMFVSVPILIALALLPIHGWYVLSSTAAELGLF